MRFKKNHPGPCDILPGMPGAAGAEYPFSAIVGQRRLKRALLLCAVNPAIHGVLIYGEKGTGKSTAVRSLASILPPLEVIKGCPFNCDPNIPEEWCEQCCTLDGHRLAARRRVRVQTLPLNASEDRITGCIDFKKAIKNGARVLEPGLLAAAHRGIMYIDEVNLLEDHLVDVILDAAASGVNRVEREGVSLSHPSRFVLVGTMNPEEGELRPQLLDRFGMCIEVSGEMEPVDRLELMVRRERFDLTGKDFVKEWRDGDLAAGASIERAQEALPGVALSGEQRLEISKLCREALVAGHRADILLERCARTIAALEGRTVVAAADIEEAAAYVLPHRRRNDDTQTSSPPPQTTNEQPEKSDPPAQGETDGQLANEVTEKNEESFDQDPPTGQSPSPAEKIFAVGRTFNVKRIETRKDRLFRRGSGRRSQTRSANSSGRYVKSRVSDDFSDLALDATLRAAAPHQHHRQRNGLLVQIHNSDVRKKIRQRRISNFIVFAVDASGSMGAKKRMVSTKGAILSLLLDAYRMRDRIAMIAFRQSTAEVVLPPTNSVSVASRLLETLPTGGRTPLSAGLVKAFELVRNRLAQDPWVRPILIFITDGRGNVPFTEGSMPVDEAMGIANKIAVEKRLSSIVVDTETDTFMQFGLAGKLAQSLDAQHYTIDNLQTNDLVSMVKEYQHEQS